MSRRKKPARLYLRTRKGREPRFVILDDGREIDTGCSQDDERGAQDQLARYLAETHTPDTSQRDSARFTVILGNHGRRTSMKPVLIATVIAPIAIAILLIGLGAMMF